MRLLTQFVNFATVDILPSVTPTAEEVAQAAQYAANVRTLMVRSLTRIACLLGGPPV